MFRGLKKKIESDQKAKIVFSPSRVEAKPGGPVRLSSTSEREDENEVEQTSLGISIHSNEDDSHRNFADGKNDLQKETRTSEIFMEEEVAIRDKQIDDLKKVVGLLEQKISDLQQEALVYKSGSVPSSDYEAAVSTANELGQKCRKMQDQFDMESKDKLKCNEQLRQQITSLQAEIEKQGIHLTTIETNLEDSRHRSRLLQQELELKATNLMKVTTELQTAHESVNDLQSQLLVTQRSNTELERKLENVKNQHHSSAEELQERIQLLEQRLKDTEMSDSDHVQAVLKERDGLELTLSETKSQIAQLEMQHREDIAHLKSQSESLVQERRVDQFSIRTLNDEVKQLQLKLSDLQEARDRDSQNHNNTITALCEKNKELVSSCDSHQAARVKLTEEADQLRATVETLKEANRTTSTASRTELEDMQRKHMELQQSVKVRIQQIDQLKEEIQQKDELILKAEDTSQQMSEQSERNVERLQQCLQDRQKEVETLRQQVADASAVHERNATDKQRTIEELYEQVQSLEVKLEQQERKAETYQPATLNIQQDSTTDWQQQMDRLQQEKTDLEEQLLEKNKALKTQQQRMADLKKTLHRELKVQTSADGKTVEYDGRDVNFEYLKYVILKFLCSQAHEARQLVKAISTLLQLTAGEERLVIDWLDYKTSWFGSVPHSPSVKKSS
ncbi:golgin subfamily A member 1-like [Corticium candelabrum]|uniref:golgin subfamily A member 1-like n=1 Tax=Corticium candelabrum TaxID=121492 RepID=UPI002E26AFC7|nr:golgin subfamily A member 1-like [Corticium candelabrum]